MLNRIKSLILQMLETLGEAFSQYLAAPSDAFYDDICTFIDAILSEIDVEHSEIHECSTVLAASLRSLNQKSLEESFQSFCGMILSLPIQYKVVFFPYYDNTWDSLESVYEAFAADPMFQTEIVIIPIQRNTPSGMTHVYNDYLTPMGIPNTPYHYYDIKTDLPDIVFYNQPYDGNNYQQFFSHYLKQYAGMMVYVPYAMYLHEFIRSNYKADNEKMWGNLPGHNSADIIIAQGESFCNAFARPTNNGSKMIALGNPKSDFLWKRANNGDWVRNSQWEELIRGKKTFLLNTHYSSILHQPMWFNETASTSSWLLFLLETIIADDELALIWRPHPQTFLMMDSLSGNNKALFDECLKIADSCDRIIVDKTPSVVSAFMYCDAVISENSSIISEAVSLNKPVFLVGVDHREYQVDSANYYKADYQGILDTTGIIDMDNLYMHNALPCCGLRTPLQEGESIDEHMYRIPIMNFINDIKNNLDPKSELRELYRRQLLSNLDGKCGSSILEYVKSLLF